MSKNKDIFTELLICDAMTINSPEDAYNQLSETEKQRLNAMTNMLQARLFILSRYLLRQRLSSLLNLAPAMLSFYHTPKGKPELASGALSFNLSHSGSLLALAISSDTVGVDVESRVLAPERIARLARRYLTTEEQQWLAQSQRPGHDFQQLWTIKEAVLKADGGGIANNLHQVTWHPGSTSACFNHHDYRLHRWQTAGATLTLATGHHQPVQLLSLADCAPALEINGPQPNLAINP
ncbi:4'-phosphopantetheinyl transferase superfamily protein [Oceanimonas baumannii]|uniref:4'-phosphopantetheinyl transferase family protein n=1 Tax=Oceanimonas baumannii TaxID=129578 RepID=UPI001D18C792|nr:4'-phosphopantetheinyl transferase superfamily protein [Oceanimonas baumannii]MCC4265360.1 4'-phosphopantetheinyl transferase superfamily protein [Oceanimonas baumannii]